MDRSYVMTGAILCLFAIGVIYQSSSYNYMTDVGPGPGFFPMWLGISLLFLSLIFTVGALRSGGETHQVLPPGPGLMKVVAVLVALIGLVTVMVYLGFLPAAVIFLFTLLTLFGRWRWWTNLGVAVGASYVLWFIFSSGLNVALPRGIFH